MRKFISTLKSGVADFIEDECMARGAALAYYTIFSLPPLLVMVFYVAGWFNISEQRINEVVSRQIGLPIASASEGEDDTAQDAGLQSVASRQASSAAPMEGLGTVSKVLGVLILVFSATGLFAQLQYALNRAWEIEPDPKRAGWKIFIVKRGLSLGMIVVIAFLLLVSLVLTTFVDEIVTAIVGQQSGTTGMVIGAVVNNLLSLVMATALFAAMYKILPDANMQWKDMWVGSFLTAILFVAGKAGLGWYLQNSQIGSAWGSAASSMVAMLVWVYYTSIIVLLGAELTQAWIKNYGGGIIPEEGAVRVVEEKRYVSEPPQSTPAT